MKKVNQEYLNSLKKDDDCLIINELIEDYLHGFEIYELGKYSNEGAILENIKAEIPEELRPACEVIKKYANDYEYGFNVLTKAELILCINSFKERVKKILEDLLLEISTDEYEKRTREERLVEYVQGKLTWFNYYTNTKDETTRQKFKVQDTWFYEYGIFDLIHALKMIDWEQYILVVTGW